MIDYLTDKEEIAKELGKLNVTHEGMLSALELLFRESLPHDERFMSFDYGLRVAVSEWRNSRVLILSFKGAYVKGDDLPRLMGADVSTLIDDLPLNVEPILRQFRGYFLTFGRDIGILAPLCGVIRG